MVLQSYFGGNSELIQVKNFLATFKHRSLRRAWNKWRDVPPRRLPLAPLISPSWEVFLNDPERLARMALMNKAFARWMQQSLSKAWMAERHQAIFRNTNLRLILKTFCTVRFLLNAVLGSWLFKSKHSSLPIPEQLRPCTSIWI